jgi:hypothetical protein
MTEAGIWMDTRFGTYWKASSPMYRSARGSTTLEMSVS